LGICLGCLAWGLIVALGLGVLLAASTLAYALLKWAGAAYLVYLGVKLIRSPRRGLDAPGAEPRVGEGAAWLGRGFLTNILNPKVGVFYVSFLPQFVPAGANVAALTILLTAVHAGLGLLWFLALIAATRPLSGLFRRAGVVTWLDRLTGGLFIAFGVRLALEARR
jgi:threonine/homoserine/homoserine lactone efflux protein